MDKNGFSFSDPKETSLNNLRIFAKQVACYICFLMFLFFPQISKLDKMKKKKWLRNASLGLPIFILCVNMV